MSVSGLSNHRAATQQLFGASASSNTGASNYRAFAAASTSTSNANASANANASEAGSSSQVTLSPDAQALAQLKANGVMVSMVNLSGAQLSRKPGEPDAEHMQQIAAALKDNMPFAQSAVMGQDGKANGTISQSDFEAVLAAFGGGKDYADQIFDSLDKDHDGSVSNAEWLHAVGSTASEPGSDTSQSLLKAMDSDGNGIVNSAEFTRFEAAMIAAEKTV